MKWRELIKRFFWNGECKIGEIILFGISIGFGMWMAIALIIIIRKFG